MNVHWPPPCVTSHIHRNEMTLYKCILHDSSVKRHIICMIFGDYFSTNWLTEQHTLLLAAQKRHNELRRKKYLT